MSSLQVPDVSCRELEFDLRELERHVNPRNPSYFPRIDVPRDMERTVEDITIEVYHQLFDLADSNPLYRFLFNVVAYKDFRNDHFDNLVEFATGCFILEYADNRRIEPRRLIRDSVERAIQYTIGLYYRDSPTFQDDLNASNRDHNDLLDAADRYFDVIEDVEDLMNPRHRGRDRRDYDRDYDRGRRDRRDGFGTRNHDRDEGRGRINPERRGERRAGDGDSSVYRDRGGFRNDRVEDTSGEQRGGFGNRQGRSTHEPDTRATQRADRVASSTMRPVPADEVQAEVESVYTRRTPSESTTRERETVRRPEFNQDLGTIDGQRIIEVMDDGMVLLEDNNRLKKFDGSLGIPRTVERPYLPAWNVNRETAFYVIDPAGTVIDLKILPLKEVKMNREEHKTAAVARAEREERLNKAAASEPEIIEAKPVDITSATIPNASVAHTINQTPETVTSMKTAEMFLDIMVRDITSMNGNKPAAVTLSGNRIDVLSNLTPEAFDVLRILRESSSLAKAVEILNQAHSIDPNISVETIDALDAIDQLLTQSLNSFVNYELDVQKVVDSFREDYQDLVAVVRNEYGEGTAKLLQSTLKPLQMAIGIDEAPMSDYRDMADTIGLATTIGEQAYNELEMAKETAGDTPVNTEDFDHGGSRWLEICKAAFKQRGILLIRKPYLISAINVSSDQLGIEKNDNVQAITVMHQPVLAKFTTQLLKHRIVNNIRGPFTHLMKTTDGVRYEFTPSAINDSMTLVRRLG